MFNCIHVHVKKGSKPPAPASRNSQQLVDVKGSVRRKTRESGMPKERSWGVRNLAVGDGLPLAHPPKYLLRNRYQREKAR